MKTEELISLLVRDLEAVEPAQNRRRFILALLVGNLMAVGVRVGSAWDFVNTADKSGNN